MRRRWKRARVAAAAVLGGSLIALWLAWPLVTGAALLMDLARLEATTVMGALLARFPRLRLDPSDPSRGPEGDVFRKPPSLWVTWT